MQKINFPFILIFAILISAVADDLSAQNDRKSKKRAAEKVQETQDGLTPIEMAVKRLDKNGDSKISRDEAPEAMLERFDRMDGNGDGVIDEQEIRLLARRQRASGLRNRGNSKNAKNDSKQDGKESAMKRRRAMDREGSMDESKEMSESTKPNDRPSATTNRVNPAALLRRLDKNKDRQVSKDEVPKRLQAAWDRIDTNKNEILDPDEMQMMLQFMNRNQGNPKNDRAAEGAARSGIVPKHPGSGR